MSNWDIRFLELAKLWRSHSTCLRDHVGAVIYQPDTHAVLSIGFNDTGFGVDNCGEGGCAPCNEGESVALRVDCRCVHAEMNAACLAARRGTALEGSWIVTTREPCQSCAKHLRQCGILIWRYPLDKQHPDFTAMGYDQLAMIDLRNETV